MRSELASAAVDLMVEHGYDGQSAEDLARSLGISRATFHRYLGSKDEAVIATTIGPEDQFAARLAAVGDQQFATTWSRLRAALEPAVELAESSPDRMRAQLRLIQSAPALGGSLRRARAPQVEALAVGIAELGHDPFDAAVLASAAIAVLDQCWLTWAQQDDADLRELLDRAFVRLARATTPTER